MFTLKSISKRNKSFVYQIEVKVSNETSFVEMPIEKVSKYIYRFGEHTTDERSGTDNVICSHSQTGMWPLQTDVSSRSNALDPINKRITLAIKIK